MTLSQFQMVRSAGVDSGKIPPFALQKGGLHFYVEQLHPGYYLYVLKVREYNDYKPPEKEIDIYHEGCVWIHTCRKDILNGGYKKDYMICQSTDAQSHARG